MALLLIILSWLVLASLVTALCLAARLGDRQAQRSSHTPSAPRGFVRSPEHSSQGTVGNTASTLEFQERSAA